MTNPRTPLEPVHAPMEIGAAAGSTKEPLTSAELATPIELCVIVPTLNERGNVDELLTRLMRVLRGINWEIVFVDDDSDDGTADELRKVALRDRRIRCLQRLGRRGLASACVEGMLATPAPFLAVMDADLQHDEACLPRMLEILRQNRADLVIGSRYVSGGSTGSWDVKRARMSRRATALAQLVFKQEVADPMSGFFMMRRSVLESTVRRLSTIGFKILLDTIASSPHRLRIAEVPFTFRERFAGDSKLDSTALWEFGMLIADKLVGRYVPVRFLSFIAVGSAGVLVHIAILSFAMQATQGQFRAAQSIATIGAMIFNFWLNNLLTYRDRRLRGWGWVRGLATFMLACSIGALANVGVASYLFENQTQWLTAALAGVLVGAVWNYAITQLYTWGKATRR
jgi:dolichol-phosphate mannosyltransferase